jgi:hypothetical protein
MARYKLTDTTCIGGSLQSAGAEVDYAGWPGSTLEPLDDEAREVKAYYDEAREAGRNCRNRPRIGAPLRPRPPRWRSPPLAPACRRSGRHP